MPVLVLVTDYVLITDWLGIGYALITYRLLYELLVAYSTDCHTQPTVISKAHVLWLPQPHRVPALGASTQLDGALQMIILPRLKHFSFSGQRVSRLPVGAAMHRCS